MTKSFEINLANARPLVIGMVHFLPLPGSPGYGGSLKAIWDQAGEEAQILSDQGADAILVENYGDVPFFPSRVPVITLTHFTYFAAKITETSRLPVGINLLRNDGLGALAIAHAVGASFIRVNILTGARLTDQGIIQGEAPEILRARSQWGAQDIRIFSDVDVKHSVPLSQFSLPEGIENTLTRGRADAIILSGRGTGKETSFEKILAARKHCPGTPLLVGSGVNPENVEKLFGQVNGIIVGSYFKIDGEARNRMDPKRVEKLVKRVKL